MLRPVSELAFNIENRRYANHYATSWSSETMSKKSMGKKRSSGYDTGTMPPAARSRLKVAGKRIGRRKTRALRRSEPKVKQ
jgi:hypothetical protein